VLRADILSLYLRLVTSEFTDGVLGQQKVRQNNRLYNPLAGVY
jgi:hypothetical protein